MSLVATISSANPIGGLAIIWIVITCITSRKRAIGGWLRLYYYQLYISFVCFGYAILQEGRLSALFHPSDAENHAELVVALLIGIPSVLVEIAEVAISTVLLSQRNGTLLKYLKISLLIDILIAVAAAVIQVLHYKISPIWGIIMTIGPAIRLAYLSLSSRVVSVFRDQNWVEH